MTAKKEDDEKKTGSPKVTKRTRISVENSLVEHEIKETEGQELLLESMERKQVLEEESVQKQFSTLDILWNHGFRELDQWVEHADFRDEVFLKEAMHFADSIRRNQENIKSAREQFSNEFSNWERTAREELLMSTTVFQHIFQKKSYKEINQQIDQIQTRTASILSKPMKIVENNQMMEKYLEIINQYISLRKNSRKQYIKTLKQAASLIYESQKGFVNLFTGQLRTFLFPLNKYMEKEEKIKK